MMKQAVMICSAIATCMLAHAQTEVAPAGFDRLTENIQRGRIDTIQYFSTTVGTDRMALIYTPPGYTTTKSYPVLYLLHGIGGDEKEWFDNGVPHLILDNLYAQGGAAEMVVVMPNGRAMKDDRATGDIMAKDKVEAFATFEKDLLNDLIPYVERQFPVKKDRQNRALFGLSMGGGQALNFGLGHIDHFAWVGGFSSAPNTRMPEQLIPNLNDAKTKLQLLWISCGDQDRLMPISQRTHEYLEANDIPHTFYVEPGGHDFEVWKNDLYMVAQRLFKK